MQSTKEVPMREIGFLISMYEKKQNSPFWKKSPDDEAYNLACYKAVRARTGEYYEAVERIAAEHAPFSNPRLNEIEDKDSVRFVVCLHLYFAGNEPDKLQMFREYDIANIERFYGYCGPQNAKLSALAIHQTKPAEQADNLGRI